MVHMVQLAPKSGDKEPAEIQIKALLHELAKRNMPLGAQQAFERQLRLGKTIDGSTVYAEFANINFTPFTISDAEAKERQMIILTE